MHGVIGAALLALGVASGAATPRPIPSVNLSQPFGLPPGWQLRVTQGADVEDPLGEKAPGPLHLCLTRDGGKTCRPSLDDMVASPGDKGVFFQPHFLLAARIIHPRPDRPLLWVEAASMYGVNGDQRVGRVALSYDRARESFVRVFQLMTGHNNNQEVRYIAKGPLQGAIVSAEPTGNAPFGFWMTVYRLGSAGRYAPVLRYRSGTRYGDGNSLAVIDSEMPEIQRRLNLWRPGQPIPLPERACARPHLVRRILWC